MNDIDVIREVFEEKVFLNFVSTAHGLRRKPTGEYVSDMLEDHWNTFQEGWEYAIEYLKKKESGTKYSDIASDGGMDPR